MYSEAKLAFIIYLWYPQTMVQQNLTLTPTTSLIIRTNSNAKQLVTLRILFTERATNSKLNFSHLYILLFCLPINTFLFSQIRSLDEQVIAERNYITCTSNTCMACFKRVAILQGTTYVYSTFVRPFVARHEPEIDRNLNELRTRAGDLAVLWWQRSSVYVQARFYELLQYVASQSNRSQQSPSPTLVAALVAPKHSTSQGPVQGPTQVWKRSYKGYLIHLFSNSNG